MFCRSSAWVLFALAVLSALVGLFALAYKPKASAERISKYMDMIQPQLPSNNQTYPQGTLDTKPQPRKDGFGSSVIDMVRPLGHYQSLNDNSPPGNGSS